MSLEDDQIRRALSTDSHPYTAHSALRAIGPSMQRARWRRKFAASATGAVLLVGAGSVALALTSIPSQPGAPAVSSDATLPPPATTNSTASTESAPPSENASALVEDAAPPAPLGSTSSARADVNGAGTIATTTTDRTTNEQSGSTTCVHHRAGDAIRTGAARRARNAEATPPSTPAPSATSQTITSTCGDVVLTIDVGTVRILSIAPRPGYVQRVGDDGPTSIEVRFSGGDDNSCEIHVELKSGGLDVEVQSPH